ncbi:MAG: 3-dehydroquinate synthase [Hyphomonadaceae bacterium]|nr:3-dehydroquinate synthase [Hyphomonadaceae bacterium]
MTEAVRVRVDLGARGYDVLIGQRLIAGAGDAIAPFAPNRRAFVVTDDNVAALHADALRAALQAAGLAAVQIVLPPGEQTKSFAVLETLCGRLLDAGLDRKDMLIALGGGVIGDLVGFAAAILLRGVDFVQIPTTLLAQVDSSVGGKTAIDMPQGKNLVGAFHQPRLVLADLDALATLPPREMRAGYAEVVKYGLIDDAAFFAWCEVNGARVIDGDIAALRIAVDHAVRAKARIVAADEREAGARALLNLGHTFGHALEACSGFGDALLHGEAVAAGMALAHRFAHELALAPQADAARVDRHLRALGYAIDLPTLPGGPYEADALVAAMAHDKKTEAGALTFILTRGIGRAFVQKGVRDADVRAFLAAQLETRQ